MATLLRMFLVAFVAVCSIVKADTQDLDKYQITVTKIDEELHCIALSNGMICHVVERDWGKEKPLVVGDKVAFVPNMWHVDRKGALQEEGDFRVSFFQDQKGVAFFVWASKESNPSFVNYVADTSVCIKPAGWFASEESVQVIELSDGSKWKVPEKFLKSVPFFAKEGARILVAPLDISDQRMFLINIDAKYYEIDCSKETVGLYRVIGVLPFQEKKSQ